MVWTGKTELIDTLWNVNPDRYPHSKYVTDELIDTLWNVNPHNAAHLSTLLCELIDTLWNVNSAAVEPVAAAYEN